MSEVQAAARVSADERREILAEQIAHYAAQGWRVESRPGDFQAIMVKGSRPNHVLHLLLSIFTLGIWLLVWLFVSAQGGESRGLIAVDEHGATTAKRLS